MQNNTFQQLEEAFTAHFKKSETTKLLDIASIWTAKQDLSEPLPHYINKLIKLVTNSIPDNQLIFAATRGMLPQYRSYMVQKEPKTIQDLLKWSRSTQDLQLAAPTSTDFTDLHAKVDYLTQMLVDTAVVTKHNSTYSPSKTYTTKKTNQASTDTPTKHMGPAIPVVSTITFVKIVNSEMQNVTFVKKQGIYKRCVGLPKPVVNRNFRLSKGNVSGKAYTC